MKNDIEKLIKNALDGYELPYKDSAWVSFQNKMDGKSTYQTYKWWIAGASVAIGLVSTLFFFAENKSQNIGFSQNKPDKEKSTAEKEINLVQNKNESQTNHKNRAHHLPIFQNESNITLGSNDNPTVIEAMNSGIIEINYNQTEYLNNNSTVQANGIIDDKMNIGNNHEKPAEIEIIPFVTDKCKNEAILIENKNLFDLILRSPSGRDFQIEANSKSEINLKETGIYQLGFLNSKTNGNFKEMNNFKVSGLPSIHLTVDDEITYKNGLPILNAEANTSEENVVWKINQKSGNKTGKNSEFNIFSKGTYTITALSKNEQGCEVSDSKTIHLNEDYNLLAMSAFNPNSADYRNNTFLPYALKERNTTFKMIILDPENGGIVFETTESTNPWTGIDRRDGKMVTAQKSFIWKVSLSNPEPGEKSEYKGTVVRVP